MILLIFRAKKIFLGIVILVTILSSNAVFCQKQFKNHLKNKCFGSNGYIFYFKDSTFHYCYTPDIGTNFYSYGSYSYTSKDTITLYSYYNHFKRIPLDVDELVEKVDSNEFVIINKNHFFDTYEAKINFFDENLFLFDVLITIRDTIHLKTKKINFNSFTIDFIYNGSEGFVSKTENYILKNNRCNKFIINLDIPYGYLYSYDYFKEQKFVVKKKFIYPIGCEEYQYPLGNKELGIMFFREYHPFFNIINYY